MLNRWLFKLKGSIFATTILSVGLSAFVPHLAWSANCLLSEILKDPAYASNHEFWEEFTQLSKNGKPSEVELKALVKKYGGAAEKVTENQAPSTKAASRPIEVSFQSKARKEISALPKNLKEKVDEFLEMALQPEGFQEIRNNPGRWHLEKVVLKGVHGYTIRLNDGYRIFFEHDEKGLTVHQVNKGAIHRN